MYWKREQSVPSKVGEEVVGWSSLNFLIIFRSQTVVPTILLVSITVVNVVMLLVEVFGKIVWEPVFEADLISGPNI